MEEYDEHGRLFRQKKLDAYGTIAYVQQYCYYHVYNEFYKDEYLSRHDYDEKKCGTLFATGKWVHTPQVFQPISRTEAPIYDCSIPPRYPKPVNCGNFPTTRESGIGNCQLVEITYHDVEFIQNECYGESRFVLSYDKHGCHRQTISYNTSGLEVHRADYGFPSFRIINGLLGLPLGLVAIIAAFIWLVNAGTRNDLIFHFIPVTTYPPFVAPGEMYYSWAKYIYAPFFIFHVPCIGLMGIVLIINGIIMLATANQIKIPGFVSWTSRQISEGAESLLFMAIMVIACDLIFSLGYNLYYLGSIVIACIIVYYQTRLTRYGSLQRRKWRGWGDRQEGKKEISALKQILDY